MYNLFSVNFDAFNQGIYMAFYVCNSEKFILAVFVVEPDALDYLKKLSCYGAGYSIFRDLNSSHYVGSKF